MLRGDDWIAESGADNIDLGVIDCFSNDACCLVEGFIVCLNSLFCCIDSILVCDDGALCIVEFCSHDRALSCADNHIPDFVNG